MKSGTGLGAVFAPTWDMVMGHKRGAISDAEYTNLYLDRMRTAYREHRGAFIQLLAQESATLCCYCRKGKFCHRLILATEILPKVAEALGIEYVYEGEV